MVASFHIYIYIFMAVIISGLTHKQAFHTPSKMSNTDGKWRVVNEHHNLINRNDGLGVLGILNDSLEKEIFTETSVWVIRKWGSKSEWAQRLRVQFIPRHSSTKNIGILKRILKFGHEVTITQFLH